MIRRLAACALLVAACGGGAHAARPAPDLVEASVVVLQDGTTVSVTDVVRNIGSAAAPRSRTAFSLGGLVAARRWVPALAPGARSHASTRFALPASASPGSYRVVACADALHRVAETRERDNCRSSLRAVVVGDRAPPVFAGLESAVTCIPGPVGGPIRSSSFRLTWHAASDDGTPAGGLLYDVYQATAAGAEDFSAPTYTTDPGATSFSTPPLPDDTGYFFVVRARDRAGNEDRNRIEQRGRNLCY